MSATTNLLRDNPGLLTMVVLLAIGAIVLAVFAGIMARAGASMRPLVFVGGLVALVILPQFAYHLGVATGAIPRRSLTWMPASEQARVYGWVENEAALAVRDGAFANLDTLFGADAAAAPGSDLRAVGGALPFADALAARMVVLPPADSVIVARFESSSAMEKATRAYATQALGLWPEIGSDGLRTASRPAGDVVKIAQAGRTLVIVSGADERAALKRLHSIGALSPGQAPSDPGSENYWLYRPAVLAAIVIGLVLLYVVVFFRGAVWAGEVPSQPAASALTADQLRQRLLAIDAADIPLTITETKAGQTIVAAWRFADARWLDMARAHRISYQSRVILDLDAEARVVRVTDQLTRFDASAGMGGASLAWQTQRGLTFFQVERGRVFGLQFDGEGRPMPKLDYAWRFDSNEMKAPLIEVVTAAGWRWRPTPWSGPAWLRWLTD